MRAAITGTPGTGKTTASKRLETDLELIGLNDLVREEGLTTDIDEERNSLVADLEGIAERLADRDGIVVESHLAHHLDVDRVVVLRCAPETLKRRLLDRGEHERKAAENAEAEALDVILSEAVDRHGLESVFEIDTTDLYPKTAAERIDAVLRGDSAPSAGTVDFTGYL